MAVVSKTKIKSKNKQYYYRFKVDFGKDIKPEYKFASDIRFWNRADTPEKKQFNAKSAEIIILIERALRDMGFKLKKKLIEQTFNFSDLKVVYF